VNVRCFRCPNCGRELLLSDVVEVSAISWSFKFRLVFMCEPCFGTVYRTLAVSRDMNALARLFGTTTYQLPWRSGVHRMPIADDHPLLVKFRAQIASLRSVQDLLSLWRPQGPPPQT